MSKHYGLCHPDKEKFSEELLRYGEIKANSEIQEIDGTNIRIRCIAAVIDKLIILSLGNTLFKKKLSYH